MSAHGERRPKSNTVLTTRSYHDMIGPSTTNWEATMSCSVEPCDRDAKSRGYCTAHYQQYNRHGKIIRPVIGESTPKTVMPCTVNGCKYPIVAKGVCSTHYGQIRRHGKIVNETIRQYSEGREECTVDECDNPKHSKDYCRKHYHRMQKTGTTDPTRRTTGGPCDIDGCTYPVRCSGLCASHYARTFKKKS